LLPPLVKSPPARYIGGIATLKECSIMHISKLILALTLASAAPYALAQTSSEHKDHGTTQGGVQGGAQGGQRPPGKMDPEKMRRMFDERFKKADTNGDGALSKAEAEKGMPMLARDFDAIDTNKDGKVTQDEIRAAMEKRRAAMKDGKGGMHDHGGKGGMAGHGGSDSKGGSMGGGMRGPMSAEDRAKRSAEMFKKADANGDGFLSEDEAGKSAPFLAKNFKAIDANNDGKLSQDEIRAWGEARRKEMAARRGMQGGDGSTAPKK
jgi:Ca2+-binding EF-hand superfamily protein